MNDNEKPRDWLVNLWNVNTGKQIGVVIGEDDFDSPRVHLEAGTWEVSIEQAPKRQPKLTAQ